MTAIRVRYVIPPVERVIVTDRPHGHMRHLHDHSTKRIRKKYARSLVFLRKWLRKDNVERMMSDLQRWQSFGLFTDKTWRRICRLLNKHGIEARIRCR